VSSVSALGQARLLGPLLRLVERRGVSPELLVPDELRAAAPDDRVPVEPLHDAFERAAEYFSDPQLGLRLGESLCLGELGPIDYVLRTAPSARDALQAANRYSTLQADGYRVLFERWHGGGLLRLVDETSWPRTVADMSISGAFKLHVSLRAPYLSRLECWFPYAAPRDTSAYERCFAGAKLRFDAPFHAFAFDEAYARAPQPGADAALHSLLRERLEARLRELGQAYTARARVRRALEQLIRQAKPASAVDVARSLRMSRRTLSRRLEQEGTSFAHELDATRRELALSYVGESERTLAEIAFLLGFSHVESFHRAFRRWTGVTPLAHRAAGAGAMPSEPRAR
jgi:AraC-like DNA-binding protein